jgi:carbonic anhydrase
MKQRTHRTEEAVVSQHLRREQMHAQSTAPTIRRATGKKTWFEPTRPELAVPSFETALARNRAFAAAGGYEEATMFPALRLLVVTCLDPRVDPAHFLGLDLGDAMVIRNGGGRVTPEVINNIAFVAQLAAKTVPDGPLFEVAVIHHTQCGAAALADDHFRHRYAEQIGADETTLRDRAVLDPAATVASDVDGLCSAEVVSPRIALSGHVYDVASGLVETVVPARCPVRDERRA